MSLTDVLGAAAEATATLSEYVATQGELPQPGDPAVKAALQAAGRPEQVAHASWASEGGAVGATGVLSLNLSQADQLGAMRGATILMTGTVIGGRQITWACASRDPDHLGLLPEACGEMVE